jgi:broad specificity phosphatase PhoE
LTTIHFVRHGRVHNPERLFYGRLPGFHLSKPGRDQAQLAAQALRDKPIAALLSSPLLRARQTVEVIYGYHAEKPLSISQELLEIHTPFDGRPIDSLADRNWDYYTNTGPPYEQPLDILQRVQDFIRQVRQSYTAQHVVAVTHGDVIAFTMLWAHGKALIPQNKRAYYPATASISSLIYETSEPDEIPKYEYVRPY